MKIEAAIEQAIREHCRSYSLSLRSWQLLMPFTLEQIEWDIRSHGAATIDVPVSYSDENNRHGTLKVMGCVMRVALKRGELKDSVKGVVYGEREAHV